MRFLEMEMFEEKNLGLIVASYGLGLLLIAAIFTSLLPFWVILSCMVVGPVLCWVGMFLIAWQAHQKKQKLYCFLKEAAGKEVIIQSCVHWEVVRVIKKAELIEKHRISIEFEPYVEIVGIGYKVGTVTFSLGKTSFLKDGRLIIESQFQENVNVSDRYIFEQ